MLFRSGNRSRNAPTIRSVTPQQVSDKEPCNFASSEGKSNSVFNCQYDSTKLSHARKA